MTIGHWWQLYQSLASVEQTSPILWCEYCTCGKTAFQGDLKDISFHLVTIIRQLIATSTKTKLRRKPNVQAYLTQWPVFSWEIVPFFLFISNSLSEEIVKVFLSLSQTLDKCSYFSSWLKIDQPTRIRVFLSNSDECIMDEGQCQSTNYKTAWMSCVVIIR